MWKNRSSVEPWQVNHLLTRGQYFTYHFRFELAIEAATEAITVKENETRAYADRGFANLKLQRCFEAAADFQKVCVLHTSIKPLTPVLIDRRPNPRVTHPQSYCDL
jgi:hypothetical protein